MKLVIEPSAGVSVWHGPPTMKSDSPLPEPSLPPLAAASGQHYALTSPPQHTNPANQVAAAIGAEFKAVAGPEVKKVGVVLCGGNQDLDCIPWVVGWQ